MLAKKTVKNQITLPKKIVDQFPGAGYFEVRVDGGRERTARGFLLEGSRSCSARWTWKAGRR